MAEEVKKSRPAPDPNSAKFKLSRKPKIRKQSQWQSQLQ